MPDQAGQLRIETEQVDGAEGAWTDDLSGMLALLSLQWAAAHRLGVEPDGPALTDAVHVARGSLEAATVMMARLPERMQGDSGWHLRPAGPLTEYAHDYETLTVRELCRERRGLVWPMSLPAGLIVQMEGDSIQAVLNKKGRDVWNASTS